MLAKKILMDTENLSAISAFKITSNSKEVVTSNVFITGDAIALWVLNTGNIDLDLWNWHQGDDDRNANFIVTGKKT